jgi:hypothetical protein
MNERIKQFAEVAGADIWGDKIAASQYFDIEKFAELIVRECIELNRQELSFSAFARMLDKYNEHFGVE